MAKNMVQRLFGNLIARARDVSNACQQSTLDSWILEEDMPISSLPRKSSRLDQKKESTSAEISFNEMRRLYKTVIAAFKSCQEEIRNVKQNIAQAENQILQLKEDLKGSVDGQLVSMNHPSHNVDKENMMTAADGGQVTEETKYMSNIGLGPKRGQNAVPKILIGSQRNETDTVSSGHSMTDSITKEANTSRPSKESTYPICKDKPVSSSLPVDTIKVEKSGLTPSREDVSLLAGKLVDIPESEAQEKESEIEKMTDEIDQNQTVVLKTDLKQENESGKNEYEYSTDIELTNSQLEGFASDDEMIGDHSTNEANELPEMVVLNHETDLKYQCDLCSEKFFTRRGRSFHRRKHVKASDRLASDENSFSCNKCDSKYTRFSDLRRHIITHCKIGKIYKCVVCEKHFLQAQFLERHMREKHKSPAGDGHCDAFTCKHCSQTFDSLIEMAFHTKEEHADSVSNDIAEKEGQDKAENSHQDNTIRSGYTEYQCDFCDKAFKRSHDLARHAIIHDPTINTKEGYLCKDCNKTHSSLCRFENHSCESPKIQISGREVTSKLDDTVKNCLTCGKRFNSRSLPIHVITHYKTINGYTCKKCKNGFSNAAEFHTHVVKQHEVESFAPEDWIDTEVPSEEVPDEKKKKESDVNTPGKCGTCGKFYLRTDSLRRHVRFAHGGRKRTTYHCDQCTNVYKGKKNLVLHVRAMHSQEKPYKCNRCDQAFIGKRHLDRHMVKHTGFKQHMCDICGKRYTERHYLFKHVRFCHTPSAKTHLCSYCSKTFSDQAQLRVHERIHTGEKPYVCQFCPAAFAQSGPLQYHIRCHTGEKPFPCDNCGKAFPTATATRKHKKRCGNQKNLKVIYQCEVCSKRFKRMENLQKHLVQHEQATAVPVEVTLFQCGLCDEGFLLETSLEQHVAMAHPAPPPELEDQVETIYMSDIQNAEGEMVTVYITG